MSITYMAPSAEETATGIYNDLMSDTPTFGYDLTRAGKYARQLDMIAQARKHGKEPAERVVQSIKARSNSELAQLLDKHERAEPAQDIHSSMPALPENAVIPGKGLLPTMNGDPGTWFEQWDCTGLYQVSPWLAEYISYSHKVSPEGYIDFHTGCALWALSTVAARRIYAPLADPMYTPFKIALVARTSLFAKTTTAKAALNVLKGAGLGWLLGDDETTPQKLLYDMAGHVPTNYDEMEFDRQMEVDRRLGMSGQIGWYYDEFNQLLDAMTRQGPMADFAGLLRKMDDCPAEYKYSTKSGGQEVITQPYLPLLANTTPANLRKHANKGGNFWLDGQWARFAFITPPADAWITKTMERGHVPISPKLTMTLSDWNKRLGVPLCHVEAILDEKEHKTGRYKIVRNDLPSHEVVIEDEAYHAYVRYRVALKELIATSGNEDLDGSYQRLADKALRIATLLGSLENDNRIDARIWALAQEIAEMFRRNLHELYSQVSTAPDDSPLEDGLIMYLKTLQGKAVTVRELAQFSPIEIRRLKTEGIRNLLVNLERSGIVECKKEGKKECYSLVA